MLPRKCRIFSACSVMKMRRVGRVINTAGPPLSAAPPPSVLSLLLLLEVTGALGQAHPHHVAGEHLGWEQSCSHPTLRREITWSAGGISK